MKYSLLLFGVVISVVYLGLTEDSMAGELEHGLLSDPTDRVMQFETVVSAPASDVWHAWTKTEGVTSFGPLQARIDCVVGGVYEWYFKPDMAEGLRGSEGCVVLSFVPNTSIAFTWNAPPSIPELRAAGVRTQVHVAFVPMSGNRTKVTLTQSGFGQGTAWDQYYAYFAKAWPNVLTALKSHYAPSPPAKEQAPMKQYIYVISPARSTFEHDATDKENHIVGQHFRYLQALLANGRLVMAGKTHDKDTPLGIVVFEAESDEEADRMFKADPSVAAGVFVGKVRPYFVALMRE